MATVTVWQTEPGNRQGAALEPSKPRPIVGLAALGVVFLAIEIWAFTGWIASGEATPTPTGPTPVPAYMKWAVHGWEVAGFIALPIFLYYFLVKPWRREGHITTDGLLCLVLPTVYWQDSVLNFFQPWYTYNSEFINFGVLNSHIPGWLSQHGNLLPEPVLFIVPLYVYTIVGAMIGGCWILRRWQARRPDTSTLRLLLGCFLLFAVVDFAWEMTIMALGLWAYPGAIRWLTLFPGTRYQYPIYEAVFASAWMTAMISLRYFRNDKGESLYERALDKIQVKGKKRTAVRVLALIGAVNATFLVYNIPSAVMGLYADEWPKDVQERSYFTNGICGPGTTYHCPGPGIPIPRPDSTHINPQGQLVAD